MQNGFFQAVQKHFLKIQGVQTVEKIKKHCTRKILDVSPNKTISDSHVFKTS
jgi:hypothetical protein